MGGNMEFPRMMYLHDGSLGYKVASSAVEAKELGALGYDFTGWPEKEAQEAKSVVKVEPKPIVKEKKAIPVVNELAKEPLPMPQQEKPKKETKEKKKRPIRGKTGFKRGGKYASTIKKATPPNGDSAAQPKQALEGEQGRGKDEQVAVA
jgi:hypothetical protein